jgi:hypothetical protein
MTRVGRLATRVLLAPLAVVMAVAVNCSSPEAGAGALRVTSQKAGGGFTVAFENVALTDSKSAAVYVVNGEATVP